MKTIVWCLVALLLVLHQDYWQWGNADLVFGFVPHSLAYHTCLSVGTAAVWYLATCYCWPTTIEAPAVDKPDGDGAA